MSIGAAPAIVPAMDGAREKPCRLAVVQMEMAEEPDANLAHASEMIRKAAAQGADVICLPELFLTRYFCQREDPSFFRLAEPVPGRTTGVVAALARELGVVLVVPLFERRAAGVYHNTAAVIDADGRLAGLYRKMHIPDDPGFYEKYYFTPGDLGFRVVDTRHARVAVLICWDQWFPEAARLAALQGAEVIFYPTAIGWHPHEKAELGAAQLSAWRTVQRGHAIANEVYVAVANRTGHERPAPDTSGIEFWGHSFIAGPSGEILAEAPAEGETALTAPLFRDLIEQRRRTWPFLRDRRIDAYGPLTARYLEPPAS